MVNSIPPAKTCAEAWLHAAAYLVENGDEAYNLVLDIDDPVNHTSRDRSIIKSVDEFLRSKKTNAISTVVNTIFPQGLYKQCGEATFVQEYLGIYDSLRRKGWGRYFERMVRWPGIDDKPIDQIHALIRRLKEQHSKQRPFRNIYELPLVDPRLDLNLVRNRQCLSHLSFKLHPQRGLTLTVIYRNHDYVARALGNFIGLGHLMAYMAKQIGTAVGPLTCISTHAYLESAKEEEPEDDEDSFLGWRISEVRQLIAAMRELSSQ